MPKPDPFQSSHSYWVSFFFFFFSPPLSLQKKVLYSGLDLDWTPKQKKFCSLKNLWPCLWLEWSKGGGRWRAGRFSKEKYQEPVIKRESQAESPKWRPLWLGGAGSQLWLVLPTDRFSVLSESDHVQHKSIRVFSESSQHLGSEGATGSDRWRASEAAAAFIPRWRLPLVWVSSGHLHLNNPFAVNGCTTHNTSFVYQPFQSSLPVCSLPVHFYGDDQHNSSLQRHPNLVERVAFFHWKLGFLGGIEN